MIQWGPPHFQHLSFPPCSTKYDVKPPCSSNLIPWFFVVWFYWVKHTIVAIGFFKFALLNSKIITSFSTMFSSMCFDNWNTLTKVGYVGWSNIAFYTQCLSSLLKIRYQNWITYNVTSCVILMNFFSHTYAFHKLSCSLH